VNDPNGDPVHRSHQPLAAFTGYYYNWENQ
jgi:hypothetical protein